MAATRSLIRSMWEIELDHDSERQHSTYLQFCQVQSFYLTEELQFAIKLLKNNAQVPKRILKQAVAQMEQGSNNNTPVSQVLIPAVNEIVKAKILHPTFDIDRAIAKAVFVMLATDLAMDSNEVSGHSLTIWNDSKCLTSIMESALPRPQVSTNSTSVSQPPSSTSPIHPSKLRAKYLVDYANVEIVWTRHLPDHLELEGKKLRVFELASFLELSRTVIGDEVGIGLAESLKRGCFTSQFLTETLMTYPLLFPPKDRQWLKAQIKPHYKWSGLGWGWPAKTPELDPRLAAPFDNTLATDRYYRPLAHSYEIYDRYPYWASRLHALYEEAEEPTPSTALGRWAERRRAARHTYWVTAAAFALAIVFGIASTVLGALQLWVAYCQWQAPRGSQVCRPSIQ